MSSGNLTFRRRWQGDHEVLPTDFKWNGRPLVVINAELLGVPTSLVGDLLEASAVVVEKSERHECKEVGLLRALRDGFDATFPPKPEEPIGLGAVVEDAQGKRYVRLCPSVASVVARPDAVWSDDGSTEIRYADFDAVKILSPGVTQ